MHAVDTNVLVRLLVQDEPQQAKLAIEMFSGPVWIAKTVLLETHWVLEKIYQFDPSRILTELIRLAGLANVELEDSNSVAISFQLAQRGVDFPDAIHLSNTPHDFAFATFDRELVRKAGRAGSSVKAVAPKP